MVPIDRREWCAARGLAKPGARGRFSTPAWDAMDEAERNGTRFIDPKSPITVGNAVVVSETGEKVLARAEVNPWAHHPDPMREGILSFGDGEGFTLHVSATEACAECGYSFGWCYCDEPTFRYWKNGKVLAYNA